MLFRPPDPVLRMKTARSLRELFSFPGFVAAAMLKSVFGDPKARIVTLRHRKKAAACSRDGHRSASRYDKRLCRARDLSVASWCLHVEFVTGGSIAQGAAA